VRGKERAGIGGRGGREAKISRSYTGWEFKKGISKLLDESGGGGIVDLIHKINALLRSLEEGEQRR